MIFDISTDSRAAVTTASNITGKPFAIFGDVVLRSQPGVYQPAPLTIFDNTPVTYVNSAWTTPSTTYWFPEREHSFVAIHPASVVDGNSGANHSYTGSNLQFTYTLPSDHNQIADILAATHRRQYISGKTTAVGLRFGHLMSQINLLPSLNDNYLAKDGYILLHEIRLAGIRTRASLTVAPAPLVSAVQTDDREISVSEGGDTGNLTITFAKPVRINNDGTALRLFDDTDAIIMLPQTFDGNSDAEIIFSYTVSDRTSLQEAVLPLKGQRWESGKSYGYRFSIERIGLKLKGTTINNWDIIHAGDFEANEL